jgi:hypothetical protein
VAITPAIEPYFAPCKMGLWKTENIVGPLMELYREGTIFRFLINYLQILHVIIYKS